ncbi:MAG TPA: amidohydrolase family protein [Planctomycetota bacterium]|nr:amidohydrolase family protein [Planctomycetota bacterium]
MGMEDQMLERARQGILPVGEEIIDTHSHFESGFTYYHIPYSTDEAVVREMDRYGVAQAFTFSFTGVGSDYTIGNDAIIRLVRKHPTRFVGFTTLNANYPKLWLGELDRCWAAGLRGIKLIPHYQGRTTANTDIAPILAWADEHGCPVLNHSWDDPTKLKQWATDFPRACFLIGHASTDFADAVNRLPNVFQDTCAVLHKGQFEKMCQVLDTDKIVYGSDFLDLDIAFGLGPILYARVPDALKRKVLTTNPQRVVKQYIQE